MSAVPVLYVNDDTVDRVVDARHGALVLAKDDCDNCAAYEAEIRDLQEWGKLGDLVALGAAASDRNLAARDHVEAVGGIALGDDRVASVE